MNCPDCGERPMSEWTTLGSCYVAGVGPAVSWRHVCKLIYVLPRVPVRGVRMAIT